ncbi:MAG: hypothetical protein KGJ06_04455 [Pseudomonadota bacterium]|nr:hypothetical protein [Pseudomonadota bacterium]
MRQYQRKFTEEQVMEVAEFQARRNLIHIREQDLERLQRLRKNLAKNMLIDQGLHSEIAKKDEGILGVLSCPMAVFELKQWYESRKEEADVVYGSDGQGNYLTRRGEREIHGYGYCMEDEESLQRAIDILKRIKPREDRSSTPPL